ncbi:RTA-like protein [Gautieria morchelliformis]|nr:RTA-like protein [Gautieria morchelliformis]
MHIMLIGIGLQLAGIMVYIILGTEFELRFHLQRPLRSKTLGRSSQADSSSSDIEKPVNIIEGCGGLTRRQSIMVTGLVISTATVVIRSIYRVIELAGGWNGVIITTEKYFNILDAAPIVIAMFMLNICHPLVMLHE